NLIIDSQGRTIDRLTGEEVQLGQHRPTLKVNLRVKKSEQFKQAMKSNEEPSSGPTGLESSQFYDPKIPFLYLLYVVAEKELRMQALRFARFCAATSLLSASDFCTPMASKYASMVALHASNSSTVSVARSRRGICRPGKLTLLPVTAVLLCPRDGDIVGALLGDGGAILAGSGLSADSVCPNAVQKLPNRQSRRQLAFHEPGKFTKLAARIRTKAQLRRLQESVEAKARRTGIACATKLAAIQSASRTDEVVPSIEWWDAPILKSDDLSYSVLDSGKPNVELLQSDWFTRLVEHPVQLKAPQYPEKPPEIKLQLTKEEQKKLRRQNRVEMQKERQEKQRLGLVPAPQPKLRMTNLMRVLGSEAVQDPTKAEAFVRAQMDKRKRDHESANAARQLTPEQRRAKKIRKLTEDTKTGVMVSVFLVKDLSDLSHRFKVRANAEQLGMTGVAVTHRDCCVVVVEGGPKQTRKFSRLMLERIRWTEGKTKVPDNQCKLVWTGFTKDRAFDKLDFQSAPTEMAGREIFKKAGVEHYWDHCYAGNVLQSVGGESA
uniref:U4/U6 small nuclear ribonucleoprotein Prp3 n=1 Tax=Macrostomum lignano TaxID=282301 RepID=A0A1I8GWK6_9PLAT